MREKKEMNLNNLKRERGGSTSDANSDTASKVNVKADAGGSTTGVTKVDARGGIAYRDGLKLTAEGMGVRQSKMADGSPGLSAGKNEARKTGINRLLAHVTVNRGPNNKALLKAGVKNNIHLERHKLDRFKERNLGSEKSVGREINHSSGVGTAQRPMKWDNERRGGGGSANSTGRRLKNRLVRDEGNRSRGSHRTGEVMNGTGSRKRTTEGVWKSKEGVCVVADNRILQAVNKWDKEDKKLTAGGHGAARVSATDTRGGLFLSDRGDWGP